LSWWSAYFSFILYGCVIFYRASTSDYGVILNLLTLYEKAFGQKVNREKTALFFSKNTPLAKKSDILAMLALFLLPSSRSIWVYHL
jgi:hypothetical protein